MNDTTLHESNNEIILKKVEGIGDGTYELKVDAPLLRLVPKEGYSINEGGGVKFDTENEDKKIDFASIASSERSPIQTRLVVTMRRPGLEWNELSQRFIVKPKRLSQKKQKKIKKDNDNSIKELSSTSESESCDSRNNIVDVNQDLISMQEKKLNKITEDDGDSTKELYTTPVRESCDDAKLAVPETFPPIIRDKNHCWIINSSDFNKQISELNNIDQSIENVLNIIKVFGDWSDFDVKVLYNATKEALFEYLREYIHKLEPSMKQLIIFVMSHGECDGFFTSDGEFVTHTEFIEALNTITKCLGIKTIIILAHCRKEPTKSKESKTPTSTNIHNFPHENILIAYSTSPGQSEIINTSGSMFVYKILRILIERLPKKRTIELTGILNKVSTSFGETYIKCDGAIVDQEPDITGVIRGGFQVKNTNYRDNKKKKK